MNLGVPQGSFISSALFILFINDLLSSPSSSIISFSDDTYLCQSFSSNPQHLAYSNISPYRNTSASLLTNDLTNVEKWGRDNLVKFKQEKTTQVVKSRKHHQHFPPCFHEQSLSGRFIFFYSTWFFYFIQSHFETSHPFHRKSMDLGNSAFFLEPVAISYLLRC